jgi:hypothetical protein
MQNVGLKIHFVGQIAFASKKQGTKNMYDA